MTDAIAKGKVLVAMPTLLDPHFRQTVVLLCEHGPEGSMGIVMNRPSEVEVSALLDDFPALSSAGRIYFGGPVGRNTMVVLCRGDDIRNGLNILENVFLARDLDIFKERFGREEPADLRCFLGYAGWAPGQLESEMHAGAWSVMDMDARSLFHSPSELLWQEMMGKLGSEWSPYATMPPDPSAN